MARLILVEDNHELASLIASAIRTRGHTALAAHTGQAALEAIELQSFDAAVVDLLLPDIPGTEVLARLKARALPAIAVSGVFKGHPFSVEAMENHGAAAFFEKPFEMNALLDTLDRLVGGPAVKRSEEDVDALEELTPIEDDQLEELTPIPDGSNGGFILPPPDAARETPPPPPPDAHEDAPANPLDEQLTPLRPPPYELPHAEVKPEAVGQPTEAKSEPIPPPEPAPYPKDPANAQTFEEPSHQVVLPFGEREKVWAKPGMPAATAGAAPKGEQAGKLESSSVPRLLTAWYQARQTGELKLRQGNVAKVVYFEKGQPIYAASNLAQERFGRFCARKGVLSPEKLDVVTALAKAQGLRTAEAMMQLGLLTVPQRQKLLAEQVRELIWSTFSWTQGEYSFVPKKPGSAGLVKLVVFPGDLIMEGVHRTETLLSLRKKVPAHRRYVPSADPPYELHQITLSGNQALLLAYSDGTKTVEDLLTLTELPEKDALATLAGLELLGLLVERRDENKSRRISFGL